MNEIVQHIPAFLETDEPRQRSSFDSLAQLLEIPFVKIWTDDRDFHKLSVSDDNLIAEQRGGRSWWVVGFLRESVPWLPEWDKGIYEVFDPSGKPLDVQGRDVSYSCGNDVGLRDGRVLKLRGRA